MNSLAWSVIEVGIGIFCPCVPCLRPLFSKIFPFLTTHRTPGTISATHSSRLTPKSATSRSKRLSTQIFELASRPDLTPDQRRLGQSVSISSGDEVRVQEGIGIAVTDVGHDELEEVEQERWNGGWIAGNVSSSSEERLIERGEKLDVGHAV